ncbi:sensor histidine kinase [Pedobacter glucosidilyticus]|uniref:sensor histidine kinase n=1 Tax=Pedobacter glucosidilyticus TaxID=1122941 RepID=UPI0026ED413A|nr:HAMP domain-containing sensor histidine kinase [Pedobacter glucosidilyticus]
MTIKKYTILIFIFLTSFFNVWNVKNSKLFAEISMPRNQPVVTILDSLHLENQDLKLQNLNKELKIESRNFLIYTILIFSLTALFLSFRLYKSGKKAKINNKILKEQNEEIIKQKKELEDLNNLKNKFFSIISHDVRGPLLSLKGTLNLLDDNLLNEQESKILIAELKYQFNSTSNLLDNLLVWSRSQMREEKIQKTAFYILPIIEDNIALERNNIMKKDLYIKIDVQEDFKLFADKEMTKIIIRNLINNALKFTPNKGKIEVLCTKNDGFAEISITDTGIGLTEKEIKEILKCNFYTTKGLNEEKGTGLGLSLSQEFIKKNNGDFKIKSKKGEGSTFLFTLPLFKEIHVKEASY